MKRMQALGGGVLVAVLAAALFVAVVVAKPVHHGTSR